MANLPISLGNIVLKTKRNKITIRKLTPIKIHLAFDKKGSPL